MGKHSVLMGDPFFISLIRKITWPNQRDSWKRINRQQAIRQWHRLAETLIDYGIDVYVIPPQLENPDLVYSSNAGFLANVHQKAPLTEKIFYLSNLRSHRFWEKLYTKDILEGVGIQTAQLTKPFEGEADLIPECGRYIFIHNNNKKYHYSFRPSIPPYQRLDRIHSDYQLLSELKQVLGSKPIIPLTPARNGFYHGENLISTFGAYREHVLVYLEGFSRRSQGVCKKEFGHRAIQLSTEDFNLFAANSFQCVYQDDLFLFLPEGTSDYLIDQIKERDVYPVLVNVSEFISMGGGSIKRLICDLGLFYDSQELLSEKVKKYREKHRYENYYKKI